MYKQFFGLQDNPFNVTPDPRYLYLTPHTQEALACMTYCVEGRKGFALLTGDVGTGKTTLLNKLLEWLKQEQIPSAFVFNPRLNPFQFLDYALSDFGVNCESQLKSAILAELNQWLLERFRAGTTAVLIVDEAQDASPELLEEIRLLTNLEIPSGKLLQIVLAGQQELEMKLRLPEFRQLRQRITLRAKTHPLSLTETTEYIATRLRVAGSDGRPIFSPEAIEALHHYSEGIPRIINILCEDSLINTYADHIPTVPREIVEAAARELELDIYPPSAPPPLPPSIDDIVKPGLVTSSPPPGRPVGQQQMTRPAVVPRTTAPASPQAAPRPRPAVPASSEEKRPVQTIAALSPRDWEPSVATGSRVTDEEAAKTAPRPSAAMSTPRQAPPAPEKIASDDEILQTLLTKEPTPKPQAPPPTVKPPKAAPKSFVINHPVKARPVSAPRQSWVVWVAVLGALIVGGVGTIFVLNMQSQGETPTGASEVSAEPGLEPQPQPSVEPPLPSAPAESVTSAEAAPMTPGEETARAVSPAPQPERTAAATRPTARSTRPAPPPERTPPQPRSATPPRPTATRATVAAPRVGGLVVWANVDAARIFLDGRTSPEWITPHEFSNLPVGRHSVVVSKAGHADVSGQTVVQEGQTASFRAELAAAGGEINIITNPPGLAVSIDGGPFSLSPIQANVSAGSHTYRIQLPDSRVYEGAFEMRTGAIITRRVDFSAGEWLEPSQ